jgi:diguanylate cyclase (GGDEF)-like protein/excisionase family DNA binding protein
MTRDEADTLLSVAQAATLLGVHPNTIRIWTDAGRLTAYRINARGDRRFRRADVTRLLIEQPAIDEPPIGGDGSTDPRRAGELAAFARIAAGLASSPTTASVARAVVEALRSEAGVRSAAVYLLRGEVTELAAHAGFVTTPPAARAPIDGERQHVGDELLLSLATRRGTLGLLVVDAASAARCSPTFLDALATTVATAVSSARLLGRARRELQRARALRSVTKELTGTLDLSDVLEEVVDLTRSLFEADKAGLWLVGDGDHPFSVAAHHGLSDGFLAEVAALRGDEETIGLRALRERRPYAMHHADSEEAIGLLQTSYAAEGIRTVCLVPLVGGDQTLGLLGLYHRHDRAWPEPEVALVQAFADQAAVAIQNARLYRSTAEQAARMQSIQDLSARLNRLTDVRAIGEAIVAEARALAEYHDIRIYRVDWESRTCEPIAFTREMIDADPEEAVALLRVEVGEGFTGWVAESGEPLLINDALEDDRGKTIEGTEDVPESMLVVPMLYEGRALGVIVLSQLGFNRFTNDDLQTMSIFAGYAAQAMANATTYGQLTAQSSELERRADSQRRLLEINERLLSTLDQAGVLETIADGLRDVVMYDNLSIYRTDQQRQVMVPVLTRERHADEVSRYIIPFGRGLMGWAVEHQQPLLANDALSDPRALQIPGTPEDPEAVAVVPLIADGEVLGTLNISRVGGAEIYFSESDFELIQLFAGQASIALRNADAHHAMSQRAETDALTGLANHGAFQRDLARDVDAASQATAAAERRLVVLMMDLDSFKAYNDRHGHPAGDALLHRAATAIYGAARTDDRVYRYGGDEFAIILRHSTVAAGVRVAERIRRAVAALTVGDPTPVTITVGVAGMPEDATDRAGLIAAADTALYYGKRSGEDRVVRADRLTAEVGDLRGTLEELASAALREGDDEHVVEHLVERATQIGGAPHHEPGETLRDALLTVSRSIDAGGVAGRGHADRVGRLATAIAERLELPDDERRAIELAARLHALDRQGVAELGAIPSLREVASLIRGYRRLLDGHGRRSNARIALGSHIIGAANGYDELLSGMGRPRVGRSVALSRLRTDPAGYRPEVLDALAATVEQRRDAGRRRRAADAAAGEERGAA